MSGRGKFAEQVAQQRDELRDRLAALEYVAEQDAAAERDPANARARERGGLLLDPVDPTRATMPVVWLRALLVGARMGGYGAIVNDPATTELLRVWNDEYHESVRDHSFDRLHEGHPELADALRSFLAIL